MQKMIKEAFLILLTAVVLALCAWLFAPPVKPVAPASGPQFQVIDQETLKVIAAVDPHLILDARPGESYRSGHIPGAHNLPAYEFEEFYPRLEPLFHPDRTVILYCSYSECRDADLLAEELTARGVGNILLYRAGYAEWEETGNTIVTGDQP